MSGMEALNRLAKWRMIFTGWQLGTRLKGDPEADAVRDHREVTILLRAEASALAALLIRKGVFTPEEFDAQLQEEADALEIQYRRRFPGLEATDLGMAIVDAQKAAKTTRGWKP
jgi:hypothetical protein